VFKLSGQHWLTEIPRKWATVNWVTVNVT